MLSLTKLMTLFCVTSIFSLSSLAYAVDSTGKALPGGHDHQSSNRDKHTPVSNKPSTGEDNNPPSRNSDEKLTNGNQHISDRSANAAWDGKVVSNEHSFDHKVVHGDVYRIDSSASSVPEPEIYAMLFAGLSLLGFIARRKKNNPHD